MRSSDPRRTIVTRVAGSVVAAGAIAVAAAGMGADERGPDVKAAAATGAAALTDSNGGQAIVSATGMRPGHSVSGTVTITNSGTAPGAVTLSRGALADTPGPGGGNLSGRLLLTVADTAAASTPVYSGTVRDMPGRPLGNLAQGAARTYRFTVALPARADDNAYRGSSTVVAFDWTATEPAVTPPPPTRRPPATTPGRRPAPAKPPPKPGAPPPAIDRAPPLLTLRAGKAQRIKGGKVMVRALCNEPCRVVLVSRRAKASPRTELRAGVLTKVRLTLGKKDAKKLVKKVRKRRKGSITLTVTVADRAGNRASRPVKIKLKR